MATREELLDIAGSESVSGWDVLNAGASAAWEAALGQADPDVLDPARQLLEQVAGNNDGDPDNCFAARRHLAQMGILGRWANQEPVTPEDIQSMNMRLVPVLRQLTTERQRGTFWQTVGTTYGLLIGRRRDPSHLALVAPPEASAGQWYDEASGQYYPACDFFNIGRANRIVPAVVDTRLDTRTLHRLPGVQYVEVGFTLGADAMDQLDDARDVLTGYLDWERRANAAVVMTAEMLIREATGRRLPDNQQLFLRRESQLFSQHIDSV